MNKNLAISVMYSVCPNCQRDIWPGDHIHAQPDGSDRCKYCVKGEKCVICQKPIEDQNYAEPGANYGWCCVGGNTPREPHPA